MWRYGSFPVPIRQLSLVDHGVCPGAGMLAGRRDAMPAGMNGQHRIPSSGRLTAGP